LEWIDEIKMMVWAATFVLMPYSFYKKNYDAVAAIFLLFGMLSLDVMIGLQRVNPDNTIWVAVATFGK
jgi:hypothetical protein